MGAADRMGSERRHTASSPCSELMSDSMCFRKAGRLRFRHQRTMDACDVFQSEEARASSLADSLSNWNPMNGVFSVVSFFWRAKFDPHLSDRNTSNGCCRRTGDWSSMPPSHRRQHLWFPNGPTGTARVQQVRCVLDIQVRLNSHPVVSLRQTNVGQEFPAVR